MAEQDSVTATESYQSGGFSVRSSMGRVDNVIVEGDSDTRTYEATSIDDDNAIVVQAFNRSDGSEAGEGTDLSDDTITYRASRL